MDKPLMDLVSIITSVSVLICLILFPAVFRRAQIQLQRERIADQDAAIDGMREELTELKAGRKEAKERTDLLLKRTAEVEARLIRRESRLYSHERYIRRLEARLTERGETLPRRNGEDE